MAVAGYTSDPLGHERPIDLVQVRVGGGRCQSKLHVVLFFFSTSTAFFSSTTAFSTSTSAFSTSTAFSTTIAFSTSTAFCGGRKGHAIVVMI